MGRSWSDFSLDDISWADDRAWAPQAVERNGKFYLYCPVHKQNGGMAIAVGISDNPAGPYKDLGYPLVDVLVRTTNYHIFQQNMYLMER